MWSTEKDFGKFVMNKLKKDGLVPIRIESASTISGMPDLYVEGAGDDYFIELKNMNKKHVTDSEWKVPWRPGQQGWSQKYCINHTKKVHEQYIRRKYTWTFVGLYDGVLLIRMAEYNEDSKVHTDGVHVFKFTTEEFRATNLRLFLKMYTYTVMPVLYDGMSWYTYLSQMVRFFIEEVYGSQYCNVDVPYPEDFVDEINFNSAWLENTIHATGILERVCRNVAPVAWHAYASYLLNEIRQG